MAGQGETVIGYLDPQSPTLQVAELPGPVPPPWGADNTATEEGASNPPSEAPPTLSRAEATDMLAGTVQLPFALAAIFRGPHWKLTEAEAMSVAIPLARALPPSWLLDRVLTASPWLIAAGELYQVVAPRVALDRALAAAAAEKEQAHDPRADSGAAIRPGADEFGSRAAPPQPPRTDSAGDARGFEGAGLGLGAVADGAADPDGTPRRHRGDDGRFSAAPAH